HGEADAVAKVDAEKEHETLHHLTNQYALQDIYNIHETGLFRKMPPNCTLATKQMLGRKMEKHHLSYAFTVNADGSHKLEPLITGCYH
ncbi:hypothetical protein DACRYDRAFT_52294, partial [Dacryopinax primogenitus]